MGNPVEVEGAAMAGLTWGKKKRKARYCAPTPTTTKLESIASPYVDTDCLQTWQAGNCMETSRQQTRWHSSITKIGRDPRGGDNKQDLSAIISPRGEDEDTKG